MSKKSLIKLHLEEAQGTEAICRLQRPEGPSYKGRLNQLEVMQPIKVKDEHKKLLINVLRMCRPLGEEEEPLKIQCYILLDGHEDKYSSSAEST